MKKHKRKRKQKKNVKNISVIIVVCTSGERAKGKEVGGENEKKEKKKAFMFSLVHAMVKMRMDFFVTRVYNVLECGGKLLF